MVWHCLPECVCAVSGNVMMFRTDYFERPEVSCSALSVFACVPVLTGLTLLAPFTPLSIIIYICTFPAPHPITK
jgi:hypothetical protein